MEELAGYPPDRSSIYLSKKRKFQTGFLGPLPKHVRCVEHNSSPDSSVYVDITRGNESDPESAKDSNSFHAVADAYITEHDEDNADVEYAKACMTGEPSTSTSSWGGNSSGIDPYSLDSRSLTTSNCSKSESVSMSGEENGFHVRGCACIPSLGYDEDCCSSEYKTGDSDCYTDKELENLLYTGGITASGDYVLSSGRWSVTQDTEQGATKLTIDKEFEQYFSTLML